ANGKGKVYKKYKTDDTLLDVFRSHIDDYGALRESEIVIDYKFKYKHPGDESE
ncbi:hypothetical protein GGF41_000385, partial [Coemansia sp. RSA 2531]